MTNANARGAAMARSAEAMLRALGGTEVRFRCPVSAAKDAQARQLGMDAPVTEDIAVSPVVVRGVGDEYELLIAPASVAAYLADRGQSAEQFFQAVLAVLVDVREFAVHAFQAEQFAGADYLYRVTLTAKS
ncbi:MAG: hypothetical protein ACRD3E_20860 [Terriglobales bacterium]